MLKTLHLQNFKAFANQQIALPALTVFTGVNGVGKSSFIQSLILLRQSYLNKDLPQRLILNHEKYVELGKTQDIFHAYAGADNNEQISIALDIAIEGEMRNIVFETRYEQNKLWLDIRNFNLENVDLLPKIALFGQNFQYLQADRIAPQQHYKVNQYDVEVLNSLGSRGENTPYFLHLNASQKVNLPSLTDVETDNYLFEHLNFWLGKMSKGARVRTQLLGDTLAQLIYSFDVGNDITPDFSPVNVGFGLTYVLPILVAVLTAKPGDMLIIENPESHLHPSGQSAIGEFLALAAQDGVQIIIETHSDHVINGIRLAAKTFEKTGNGIAHDAVAIYYLNRNLERHVSNAHHIAIDLNGKLFQYQNGTKTASLPKGFNDEITNNLIKLI